MLLFEELKPFRLGGTCNAAEARVCRAPRKNDDHELPLSFIAVCTVFASEEGGREHGLSRGRVTNRHRDCWRLDVRGGLFRNGYERARQDAASGKVHNRDSRGTSLTSRQGDPSPVIVAEMRGLGRRRRGTASQTGTRTQSK